MKHEFLCEWAREVLLTCASINKWPRESPAWHSRGWASAFTVVKAGAQVEELPSHRLCAQPKKKKATHKLSNGLQDCHILCVNNESVCFHH